MKKNVLCAISLALLLAATGAWAESGKCPPDKKAVESFCQQKSAGKVDQCVKEINANCKQNQQAAGKAVEAEKTRVEMASAKATFDHGYAYHLCVFHYGGGFIGCAFWLAQYK